MELKGFEPLTFCMPCRRAPNCATAPIGILPAWLAQAGGYPIVKSLAGAKAYLLASADNPVKRLPENIVQKDQPQALARTALYCLGRPPVRMPACPNR